tara:strand:- start:409 stop:510 length:102 start_codon:yes stop_codon:yes gene_type:complete
MARIKREELARNAYQRDIPVKQKGAEIAVKNIL